MTGIRVLLTDGCLGDGEPCLKSVSVPSWQAVVPPRIRDDVEDEPEGDIAGQLQQLVERYRGSLDEWMQCVAELGGEIEYRPPEQ